MKIILIALLSLGIMQIANAKGRSCTPEQYRAICKYWACEIKICICNERNGKLNPASCRWEEYGSNCRAHKC